MRYFQNFFVSAHFQCGSDGNAEIFGVRIGHSSVVKHCSENHLFPSEFFGDCPVIALDPFFEGFEPVFDVFGGIPLGIGEMALGIDEGTVIEPIPLGQAVPSLSDRCIGCGSDRRSFRSS